MPQSPSAPRTSNRPSPQARSQGPRRMPTKKQRRRGPTQVDRMLQRWWQRPWVLGGGGLLVVVVVILVVVLVVNLASPGVFKAQPVPASVLSQVNSAGQSLAGQIGNGGSAVGSSGDPAGEMIRINNSTNLTSAGRPEVVYVGGEFCPYCAAERWAIVSALDRFGSFSGLEEMVSSPTDVYPSTHTFTFVNATYTSQYVAFDSNEIYSNVPDPSTGYYQPLQSLSSTASTVFPKYGQAPYQNDQSGQSETFPFLDIANRFDIYQVQYSPQLLQNLTWSQISADLSNPQSPVAQAIIGSANYLTAAICIATGDQPASACSGSAIQTLESTLNGLKATG